jgi:hypothetical protein
VDSNVRAGKTLGKLISGGIAYWDKSKKSTGCTWNPRAYLPNGARPLAGIALLKLERDSFTHDAHAIHCIGEHLSGGVEKVSLDVLNHRILIDFPHGVAMMTI